MYMGKHINQFNRGVADMPENKRHIFLGGTPYPDHEKGYVSTNDTKWLGIEWESYYGTLEDLIYKVSYVFDTQDPKQAIAVAKLVKKEISKSLLSGKLLGDGLIKWEGKDGDVVLQTAIFLGGTVNVFITSRIWE